MLRLTPTAIEDMVTRRKERQTFETIAAAHDLTVHQCHRIVTKELRARGIFLPTGHRVTSCTHPFFD